MSRLTQLVDRQTVRLVGDDVILDGVPIQGYFYKSVIAPEFGTQSTELVEFYVDVFRQDVRGLMCCCARVDGVVYEVVRQGEADDTSMVRLHLTPAGERKTHQDAGV